MAPSGFRFRVAKHPLLAATIVAFAIRLFVCLAGSREPAAGLESGYLATVASLASGRGALMPSALSSEETDVIIYMKQRESAGGRIDSRHPFPKEAQGWLPATVHPPGYSSLLFLLYRIGNYTWMIRSARLIQASADALTCLLVYLFIRNLFGAHPALVGAWIYALLPQPISLTPQLLPDSLSCFFAAAILALATRDLTAMRYGFLTGAVIGIASQFRAEFMIWSAIVIASMALASVSLSSKLRFGASVLIVHFVVLLPWMLWTYRATGRALLSSTASGGSLYETLGEDPQNPWGIRLLDDWITQDAVKRGFSSAWSLDADEYYRTAFYSSVREHPMYFAKLVLLQRLPLALVPPYTFHSYAPTHTTFITERRLKEGLSRWGVAWKYPWQVLKDRWDSVLMGFVSLPLLIAFFGAFIRYRQQWKQLAWLFVPWALMTSSLCVLKQVEARNLASNIVLEVAGSALLLTRAKQKIGSPNRRLSPEPKLTAA